MFINLVVIGKNCIFKVESGGLKVVSVSSPPEAAHRTLALYHVR